MKGLEEGDNFQLVKFGKIWQPLNKLRNPTCGKDG
jgi:hypothetical protein